MSRLEQSFKEKRNFIRMKVDTPITVKNAEGDEIPGGHCLDLSGGGMLITVPSAMPVGSEIEVSLSSHHGHSPMLRARARVNRIVSSAIAAAQAQKDEPAETDQICKVGLEILAMMD